MRTSLATYKVIVRPMFVPGRTTHNDRGAVFTIPGAGISFKELIKTLEDFCDEKVGVSITQEGPDIVVFYDRSIYRNDDEIDRCIDEVYLNIQVLLKDHYIHPNTILENGVGKLVTRS